METPRYKCNLALWHHKPVNEEGDPSSNNGWIYTAIADKLGLVDALDKCQLYNNYLMCHLHTGFFKMHRLPYPMVTYKLPPISRDEIIGMASLGLLKPHAVADKSLLHPKALKVFKNAYSLRERITGVYSLLDRHRNYVWQKPVLAAYTTVFKIKASDMFYINKRGGAPTTLWQLFSFIGYCAFTLLSKDPQELKILWLMLDDLYGKFGPITIDIKQVIRVYFGKGHPFYAAILEKK